MKEHLQSPKIIIINMVITFLEGFAPAWFVTGNKLDRTALIGAGAAGGSLVWNTIIKPWMKSNKILYN